MILNSTRNIFFLNHEQEKHKEKGCTERLKQGRRKRLKSGVGGSKKKRGKRKRKAEKKTRRREKKKNGERVKR